MLVPSRAVDRGTWPVPHEAADLYRHSAAAVLAAERSVEVHAAAVAVCVVAAAVVPDQVQTWVHYASYTVAVHRPPLAVPAAFGSEGSGRHIAVVVVVVACAVVAYFDSSFAAADGVDLGP